MSRVGCCRLPTDDHDGQSGDLCKALAAPCYTAVSTCERLTEGFLRLAAAAAVTMANQVPSLTSDLAIVLNCQVALLGRVQRDILPPARPVHVAQGVARQQRPSMDSRHLFKLLGVRSCRTLAALRRFNSCHENL